MDVAIKGNSKMTTNMVKESILGQVAKSTTETGSMESKMEKQYFPVLMGKLEEVFGKMEISFNGWTKMLIGNPKSQRILT